MSTRFTCLLGALVLVSIGFLLACGTSYKSTTDGLVVVPTLGSALVQSYSFNLNNGHISQVNNGNGPALPGPPQQSGPAEIILDPAGAFAYVAESVACSGGAQGLLVTYKVNSNGTLSSNGTPTPIGNCPVGLVIDSAGKFLFVASELTTDSLGHAVPGSVQVFSIGSGAALTEVPGSPFALMLPGGAMPANPSALVVTPTQFPVVNAGCTNGAAPTTETVYVTDAANNTVQGYAVDSSGTLHSIAQPFPTGTNPSGVAVDPCARFVYVANSISNNVSAFSICNSMPTSSPMCTASDWSLWPISGSPFVAGNGPGPAAVDPTGNFLYVVDVVGSQVSSYRISSATGGLVALSPAAVSTNGTPVAIAIRGDDSWMFVANSSTANVSQYSITPATGALAPQSPFSTDNYPWGVAVK